MGALLQKNVNVKEAQLKKERSNYLPTIALSAGYTYYGNLKLKSTTTLPDGSPYSYTQEYKDGVTMGILSVSGIPARDWKLIDVFVFSYHTNCYVVHRITFHNFLGQGYDNLANYTNNTIKTCLSR